jgi:hypothetical protein
MSTGEKKGVSETSEGDRTGLRNEGPGRSGPQGSNAQSLRRSGIVSRRRSAGPFTAL